ncbi:uncharacterized protein LOC122655363 [Telopea speciosissima]|uniref:uncharacterized protein LOC122655363 n=1 Tax=Telopea speciosissima TaxID=54955 RepID=UPI001CC563D8|nr:uncharacterized protein LOC122655363 [Telopea speciosissima]
MGDHEFLRVSPSKGVIRFSKKGKLSPRFIGSYKILARIGLVTYRLALPPSLEGVYDDFHVSMLKKYVHDPTHISSQEPPELADDMTYEEQPKKILERQIYTLCNRSISYMKVQWSNYSEQEASWEVESELQAKYSHLFNLDGKSISRTNFL